MGKVIAFANQKGGVGKTTSCDGIGTAFSLKGYKVLFVDFDGQCNLSQTLNAELKNTCFELILNDIEIEDAIQKTKFGDILPSKKILSSLEGILSNDLEREYKLKEQIDKVKDRYDYVFIDTPPSLGLLTINALTAADGVIITSPADSYSLEGVADLSRTIMGIKKRVNPKLEVSGILITKFDGRSTHSKNFKKLTEDAANALRTFLYKNCIRECVSAKEAQTRRTSVHIENPKSNVSMDYKNVVEEMLERGI